MNRKRRRKLEKACRPSNWGQTLLTVQDRATAAGHPLCLSPDEDGDLMIGETPHPASGGMCQWVAPAMPGIKRRHPVLVIRSEISGKWAVSLETPYGIHTLDVFHDLEKALRSAQNAQVAFGQYHAIDLAPDSQIYTDAVLAYMAADQAAGIESDDEFLATCVDSGCNDGFRVMIPTGSVPADRLAPAIDAFRAAGMHVRMGAPE